MAADSPPSSRTVTVRNAFFSGLLLVAPLVVTVWAFSTIIEIVGGRFHPLFDAFVPANLRYIEIVWKLLATLIVIVLVTALGYLSHYVFGKLFFEVGGRFIQGIPGVGADETFQVKDIAELVAAALVTPAIAVPNTE